MTYFPVLNSDIPEDIDYLDHLQTSVPNALMTRMYFGASELVKFEWLNQMYLVRLNGNDTMTLTLIKINFDPLFGFA